MATSSAEGSGSDRVFGHVAEATCGGPCGPFGARARAMVSGSTDPSSTCGGTVRSVLVWRRVLFLVHIVRSRRGSGRDPGRWRHRPGSWVSGEAGSIGPSWEGARGGWRTVRRRAGWLTGATRRAGWRIQPIGCLVSWCDGSRRRASRGVGAHRVQLGRRRPGGARVGRARSRRHRPRQLRRGDTLGPRKPVDARSPRPDGGLPSPGGDIGDGARSDRWRPGPSRAASRGLGVDREVAARRCHVVGDRIPLRGRCDDPAAADLTHRRLGTMLSRSRSLAVTQAGPFGATQGSMPEHAELMAARGDELVL